MVPLGELFNSFNRLVFELANKLNKKINLQIQGGRTELDKNMIEELRDPLMHLIRNCADHGIENACRKDKCREAGDGHNIFERAICGIECLNKNIR